MEEQKQGAERRRFPRLDVELIVRYKVLSTSEQEFEATTKNISQGGLCLLTHEELKPDTFLAVEIKFPQTPEPVVAIGHVVWSQASPLGPSPAGHRRFDNGIEFEKISDSDRQRIGKCVDVELKKEQPQAWKVGMVRNIFKNKNR